MRAHLEGNLSPRASQLALVKFISFGAAAALDQNRFSAAAVHLSFIYFRDYIIHIRMINLVYVYSRSIYSGSSSRLIERYISLCVVYAVIVAVSCCTYTAIYCLSILAAKDLNLNIYPEITAARASFIYCVIRYCATVAKISEACISIS